jgi:LPS sulfotransferase NodH
MSASALTFPSDAPTARFTELQISSELLDQPDFNGEPKPLFICSTPRSGSYLLCRFMINAGLGVPHEYFNPVVIHQMAPRLGLAERVRDLAWLPRGRRDRLMLRLAQRRAEAAFLPAYIRILQQRRCQGGVFAAKIHFRDFARVLDNPVGHRLMQGAVFVFLYRQDMLKQAVSEHFGQLTGRWGIDDTVTTTPAAKPNFFDVSAIDRALSDLAEQERGWRMFLARQGAVPLSISYERLCKDPFGFVAEIARRLGIDPATLRHGYNETAAPAHAEPGLPSKAEVARHYLAATRGRPAEAPASRPCLALRRLFGT